MGRHDGKRPPGRPKHRWEYTVKKDIQEVGWEGFDSIDLAEDGDGWWVVVNAVMNLPVP